MQTDKSAPGKTVPITGVVRTPDGKTIASARVAAIQAHASIAEALVDTDDEGRFRLRVREGQYALTATATGYGGAYQPPITVSSAGPPPAQELALTAGGVLLKGKVLDGNGSPLGGVALNATRWSEQNGDIFYGTADASGDFAVQLPEAMYYTLSVETDAYTSVGVRVAGTAEVEVQLRAHCKSELERPAPQAVVDWVRGNAIALAGTEPGVGTADLAALGPLVSRARVVGMGEATHGSREFFQLKHRLLEYLVEEQGFTVFAIEGAWAEAFAVNRYIVDGEGTAAEALAGMHFWTWDTEEVLAMIEWMRAYNEKAEATHKIKFYGIDMQFPAAVVTSVLEYLAIADPELSAQAQKDLRPLTDNDNIRGYGKLPPQIQEATREGIALILQRLDVRRAEYVAATSAERWRIARQHAVVLAQGERLYAPREGELSFEYRDRAMAENVEWILSSEPEGVRVAVWAHNRHVTRHVYSGGVPALGKHLAQSLGDRYVAIGFSFSEGSFQARDGKPSEQSQGVIEHTIGRAKDHFVGATLARTGLDAFAVVLRDVDSPAAATWLAEPHPMRQLGAVYLGTDDGWSSVTLRDHFDALIFTKKTTRARPTETGKRGPGE